MSRDKWSFDVNGTMFTIPEHMRSGLTLYVEEFVEPGSFLLAVLSNNLTEAIGAADCLNVSQLPGYAAWMYNEAPSECWGSSEKVVKWLEKRKVRT